MSAKTFNTNRGGVTRVNERSGDIIISGQNIYKGTKNFDGDTWLGINPYILMEEKYNGFTVMTTQTRWQNFYQKFDVEPGYYTVSFWGRSDKDFSIAAFGAGGDNNLGYNVVFAGQWIRIDLTPEWRRVSATLKASASGNVGIAFSASTDTDRLDSRYYICGVKVERGNVMTPWTPHPEDIPESIEARLAAIEEKVGIPQASARVFREEDAAARELWQKSVMADMKNKGMV